MPKRVTLDYKHQNLTDDAIVDFIENTVKPDIASSGDALSIRVDFSFNRLGTGGLRAIAELVKGDTRINEACVGFNLFDFSAYYNTLSEMRLTKLVEEQRIITSSSSFDLELETQFDKFEEARRRDVQTADQQLRETAAAVKSFADAVKQLDKRVTDVLGRPEDQNDRLEVQMTAAVRSLLGADDNTDVTDLPGEFNRVPGIEPVLPHGFEWDAVLFSTPPDTVWLVKAKNAVSTADIADMPERISRTSKFLQLIYEQKLPLEGSKRGIKQLCKAWKEFDQMPEKIVGVVAAMGFTDEQLRAAAEHNIKCVYLKGDAFAVV